MLDDNAHADPWHVPPAASDAPKRAAIATWAVALVQFLAFGCCSCILTVGGLMPEQQVREQFEQAEADNVTPEQIDGFLQLQPLLLGAGVTMLAVIVIPALILIILAFKVRAASLGATAIARLILIIQTIAVGLFLLLNVSSAIAQGELAGVLMPIVLLGGLMLLMIWAVRRLGEARDAIRQVHDYNDQPWNV